MNDGDGWGDFLDDMDGADYAELFTLPLGSVGTATFDDGDDYFEAAATDAIVHPPRLPVRASAQFPPCLLTRNFWSLKEAQRFRCKAIAEVTSPVTLRSFGKHYQVAYRADTSAPLKHYRDRCRYSIQEAHFIVRQYMMWMPLCTLAEKLDRKISAVETQLVHRGFRVIYRNSTYGVGQLEFQADNICREITDGYLLGDTTQILTGVE